MANIGEPVRIHEIEDPVDDPLQVPTTTENPEYELEPEEYVTPHHD